MPDIIQIKRGLKEHLPQVALEGELLLCTDTSELYVGINGGVQNVAMQSDILIHSEVPMPETIGGLEKGTTFENVPIAEVFMQLLYKYAPPLMSLTTNQPNLNESGLSLSGTTCVMKITKQMHEIKTVRLYRDGRALQTWDNIIASDFVTPVTLIYSDSVPLATDTTYLLEVTDTEKTTSKSLFINFELPNFIGACTNKIPSADDINRANKTIKKKANFSHSFTTNNERMMVIYPQSWGELRSAKNPSNLEIFNTFEHIVIQHTTIAGTNNYHAYISNLTTLNNHTITFIF